MHRAFVGLSLICLCFVLALLPPSVSSWSGSSPIPAPLAALNPSAAGGTMRMASSQPLTPAAWLYLPVLLRSYQSPFQPTATVTRTPTVPPPNTPTPTPTVPPSNWITIVGEDFEGAFPGPWLLTDEWPGFGEYLWAKRNCRPYAGSHSGWAVGGGGDGASQVCGADYPNRVSSWMTFGPFSLADATAAELTFKLWLQVEAAYDWLSVAVSTDGAGWYEAWSATDTTGGWVDVTLDLRSVPSLGILLGKPQVWIALGFDSDTSESLPEGVYVDDIILRKCTAPHCTAVGHSLAAPDSRQPTFVPVIDIPLR